MKLFRTIATMLLFTVLISGISYALVDLNKDDKDKEPAIKKSQLMQKIESRLGRELTKDENRAYLVSVRKAIAGIESIQQKFVKDISDITGITNDKIWDWIPRQGGKPDPKYKNMISKIEKELGRELKKEEIARIMKADENKKNSIKAIQKKFADELSGITGIPANDILLMLPKVETKEK